MRIRKWTLFLTAIAQLIVALTQFVRLLRRAVKR